MKNKKFYLYAIAYASSILRDDDSNNFTRKIVYSHKKLRRDNFIIVERIGSGVFIGKIMEEIDTNNMGNMYDTTTDIEYRYVKDIDLSDYISKINNEKRKEELEKEMQERFKEVDKEKKYEYYASIDKDMKRLYDEYKNLKEEN